MIKFFDVFRRSTVPVPKRLMNTDEPIYMTIDFRSGGHLLHNAVVTAQELERCFGHHDCEAVITGYMSQADAMALTLEERGMLPPPPLRPATVPENLWNDADDKMKAFLVEHERLHEVARRKHIAEVTAKIQAVFDQLTDY